MGTTDGLSILAVVAALGSAGFAFAGLWPTATYLILWAILLVLIT